jgi:hypothetical protein
MSYETQDDGDDEFGDDREAIQEDIREEQALLKEIEELEEQVEQLQEERERRRKLFLAEEGQDKDD